MVVVWSLKLNPSCSIICLLVLFYFLVFVFFYFFVCLYCFISLFVGLFPPQIFICAGRTRRRSRLWDGLHSEGVLLPVSLLQVWTRTHPLQRRDQCSSHRVQLYTQTITIAQWLTVCLMVNLNVKNIEVSVLRTRSWRRIRWEIVVGNCDCM